MQCLFDKCKHFSEVPRQKATNGWGEEKRQTWITLEQEAHLRKKAGQVSSRELGENSWPPDQLGGLPCRSLPDSPAPRPTVAVALPASQQSRLHRSVTHGSRWGQYSLNSWQIVASVFPTAVF